MYTSLLFAFYPHVCYNMYVYLHKMAKIMIITFCGHSNYISTLEDETRLLNLLEILAIEKPVDFYLGDTEILIILPFDAQKKYKDHHPNTNLIFITPYLDKWLHERKSILEKEYNQIIYPEIEHIPQKFAIMARNKWMIDQADYIFA